MYICIVLFHVLQLISKNYAYKCINKNIIKLINKKREIYLQNQTRVITYSKCMGEDTENPIRLFKQAF